MRRFLLLVPLLAACSPQPAAPSIETGTYSGNGRDRLCIARDGDQYRAGFIVYGSSDTNCSASGRVEMADGQTQFVPRGEGACRIGLRVEEGVISIGEVPGACAYYCGPAVEMSGRSFRFSAPEPNAVDVAGKPLC